MNYSYLDKDVHGHPNLPEQPKLSICLITYKHAEYIRTCLDNILSQQVNFSYEIILGEDHSPDDTAAIVAEKPIRDRVQFLKDDEFRAALASLAEIQLIELKLTTEVGLTAQLTEKGFAYQS